jgi:hypothetical protein
MSTRSHLPRIANASTGIELRRDVYRDPRLALGFKVPDECIHPRID